MLRNRMIPMMIILFLAAALLHARDTKKADKAVRMRITAVGDSKQGLSASVNLDAEDAFLPSILATLSRLSGYNVVTGPEVNKQQRITIHLKNTPVEEAINLVVRAAGLSYEIVGNSFLVTGHENLEKDVGINSYLIELQYAKAREMQEFLKELVDKIQVVETHNALLISTSPKVINEIRNIVERIDVPSKQIVLRTRVIEVQVDKLKELGVDWEKLSKLTTIIAERPFDAQLGGRSATSTELGDPALGTLPPKHLFQQIDGLKNVGYYDRQLTAFDITLDFMLKDNMAELLTDTKLATMNNRKASIHIGEEIPFIVRSQESARVEREKIGINVEIIPQINDEGLITATVRPEASTIIELINGEIPRKKIRTAETTVLVRDRQKIIIAGLLSNEETIETYAIPFFGELPFFGKFFSHYDRKNVTTDLIIEITPYILDNQDPMADLLRDSLFSEENPIERQRRLKEQAHEAEGTLAMGPTHYMLFPASGAMQRGQYVVGLQEISVGHPGGRFQVFFSPLETIGKLRFGLKYRAGDDLALGFGYHNGTFVPDESLHYKMGRRFGVFVAKDLIRSKYFGWNIVMDAQLGDTNSYGGGMGLQLSLGDVAMLMAEVGESYKHDPATNLNYEPFMGGALRLRPPWSRSFSLDAGLILRSKGFSNKPLSTKFDVDYSPRFFANLCYSGVFKKRRSP